MTLNDVICTIYDFKKSLNKDDLLSYDKYCLAWLLTFIKFIRLFGKKGAVLVRDSSPILLPTSLTNSTTNEHPGKTTYTLTKSTLVFHIRSVLDHPKPKKMLNFRLVGIF